MNDFHLLFFPVFLPAHLPLVLCIILVVSTHRRGFPPLRNRKLREKGIQIDPNTHIAETQPPPPRMSHYSPSQTVVVTVQRVEAKERELEMLRRELQMRSQRVDAALAKVMPNFPPRFLCIRPIVYHDIMSDVAQERQRYAKVAYYGGYLALAVIVLLNIIAALIGFVSPNNSASTSSSNSKVWGTHFGVSFLYLLAIPGAFMVWYFPSYTAITKGDSGKYTLASFGMFLGFAFDVLMAVGIFGLGGCGWLYVVAAQAAKTNPATTIASIITSVAWSGHAVVFLYMWSQFRTFSAIDHVRSLGMDVVPATGASGQIHEV